MPKNTVGRSRKQKVKFGFQRWDCKINFIKSTFRRKSRIEIYRISTFRNFWKTYITPLYLEKVRKFVNSFWSLTLFMPQSNNCLVCVRFAVKKREIEGERSAFLFVETIPFSKGYYMMLDMGFIEIIWQRFDPLQLTPHAVITTISSTFCSLIIRHTFCL